MTVQEIPIKQITL